MIMFTIFNTPIFYYYCTELQSEFPKYGLFMAGSSMNGFGLKNSDVDFSFLTKEKDCLISKDCLEKLFNHLKTLR